MYKCQRKIPSKSERKREGNGLICSPESEQFPAEISLLLKEEMPQEKLRNVSSKVVSLFLRKFSGKTSGSAKGRERVGGCWFDPKELINYH